tara:strand:- start:1026 stop:1262 length:237 start_codon:yes stop_codon:yes gene_type:complete
VKNSIKNICSEFSDSYIVDGDEEGVEVKIEVEIEDLGDLATVFDGYGLELMAIESVTDYTSQCQATFFKEISERSRAD